MTRNITLFVTGTDYDNAIDNGLLWDNLDDAREYAQENDSNVLRIFRLVIPMRAVEETIVPWHSEEETRELAERIPAGLRHQALDDSVAFYGIEK